MHELVRLSAAVSMSLVLGASADVNAVQTFDDPIKGSAHGAVFGADGHEIDVTADFIAHAQDVYTARALRGTNAAQRALFKSKSTYLDDIARGAARPGDPQASWQARLFARSLLLDWAIDNYAPDDSALLKARNRVLIGLIRRGLGYMDGRPYSMLPHEQALYSQAGVLPPVTIAAGTPPSPEVLQARETYAKQCRKAGVPIPPTWDESGAVWKSKGVLASPFISRGIKAELYEFQSAAPQGVCLALPRYADATSPIQLLGIICQGVDTSNACFWDNQQDKMTLQIERTGQFPLNTTFAAGPELKDGSGGTCTACHAGENAYIVHPEDPAFSVANLAPDAWYKPFNVPAGWPLNPGPNVALSGLVIPAGERKCTTCHDLPTIVKALATPAGENYCDAVLTTAINGIAAAPPDEPGVPATMPRLAGAHPNPTYKTQIDFILQQCADAAKP